MDPCIMTMNQMHMQKWKTTNSFFLFFPWEMIGFYGNKRLPNYKANYIKAKATSNIQLQENWQEAARCEYIKIKHLEFNRLHKTIVLCKLRPKQQVKGTIGPNKILMTSQLSITLFL